MHWRKPLIDECRKEYPIDMTTPFLLRSQAAQGNWLDALALLDEVLPEHSPRWDFRVHYDAQKLCRVLADVRGQIREGKEIRNREAFAEDTWKKFV